MRLLSDEEEELNDTKQKIQHLIIEMSRKHLMISTHLPQSNSTAPYLMPLLFSLLSAVTDIDTSGIHSLEDLYKALKKRDIEVSDHRLKCDIYIYN